MGDYLLLSFACLKFVLFTLPKGNNQEGQGATGPFLKFK